MGTAPPITAAEIIKQVGNRFTLTDIPGAIRRLCLEKDWKEIDIRTLAMTGAFGSLFQHLLNRAASSDGSVEARNIAIYDFIGQTLINYSPMECEKYTGSHAQNKRIDGAGIGNSASTHIFRGAASAFQLPDIAGKIPASVRNVPIAVVGYGAAGIIVTAALKRLGFGAVHVYEKSEGSGGIWKQKNVYERSRNNPRAVELLGHKLEAAPGSGSSVLDFLTRLAKDVTTIPETVRAIKPGHLKHTLVFDRPQQTLPPPANPPDSGEREYPIVINCMGIGKPAPLSDHDRMSTFSHNGDAGARWQQTLTRQQMDGKKLTFIGLGNSTAEMIRQIHAAIDKNDGLSCDYNILTHYPRDSVWNPDSYVDHGTKKYRVFRDLSIPNLTKFHGDLPEFRDDYFRALRGGKIISDVRSWSRAAPGQHSPDHGTVSVQVRNAKKKRRDTITLLDNQAWTLIGYRHPPEDIKAMGCRYDEDEKCALYDFDGEFIQYDRTPYYHERMYHGYFGFGAVLTAPHNPNAMVIPGMVYRVGDLLMGVIMRATEHARVQFKG